LAQELIFEVKQRKVLHLQTDIDENRATRNLSLISRRVEYLFC